MPLSSVGPSGHTPSMMHLSVAHEGPIRWKMVAATAIVAAAVSPFAVMFELVLVAVLAVTWLAWEGGRSLTRDLALGVALGCVPYLVLALITT